MDNVRCNCGQVVIQTLTKDVFTGRPQVDFLTVTQVYTNRFHGDITVYEPHRCEQWSAPINLTEIKYR